MSDRFLVLGGFEPSGHDATASAVIEAGRQHGHDVTYWRWSETSPIAQHPIFLSHRFAASRGVPELAGMLDEPWIAQALYEDLGHLLPMEYDGYISVHPWSSIICACALHEAQNTSSILIDYYSEFGLFPAVVHPRIDAYFGGATARALEPSIRDRCHRIGVAVPSRFWSKEDARRDPVLVVSGGVDGWAVSSLIEPAKRLIDQLKPERAILLAPTSEAEDAWLQAAIPGEIVSGVSDISGFLRSSRWYLTKGGGTAVAEGIAAGCVMFVARSGIFWEDEAAYALAAQRAVALVEEATEVVLPDAGVAAVLRQAVLGAPNALWTLVESRRFVQGSSHKRSVVVQVIDRITDADGAALPKTTQLLLARLRDWLGTSQP